MPVLLLFLLLLLLFVSPFMGLNREIGTKGALVEGRTLGAIRRLLLL